MIELTSLLTKDDLSCINYRQKIRFFIFSGEEKANFDLYDKFLLSKNQKIVVSQLIIMSFQKPVYVFAEFMIFLKNKGFQISDTTVRRTIKELKDREILQENTISYEGDLLKAPRGYTFCHINDSINYNDKKLIEKSGRNVRKTRDMDIRSQVEAAAALNFQEIDLRTDKRYLPSGAMFREGIIPREIHDIAPQQARGTRYVGKSFMQSNAHYHIHAKAADQVVTAPGLTTLMVIINIAIAHNAKLLSQKRIEKAFEHRVFPVHMLDILELRGIRDNGQARERIRDQVESLNQTTYYATDLKGQMRKDLSDLFDNKNYIQDQYRFIEYVQSNASEKPKFVGDRLKISPNLFFITLSQNIEKILSEGEFMFSLPWPLMKVEAILLHFYITLRRNKVESEVFTIKELCEKLFYDNDPKNLQKALEKAMHKHGFALDESNSGYDFNLCGYRIKSSVNPDGAPQYRIDCDLKELVECVGAKYKAHLGDKNAPTLPNPLVTKTADELIAETSINIGIKEFRKRFVLVSTLRARQFRKMVFGLGEYTLTAYCDDKRCAQLATIIQAETGCEYEFAVSIIENIKSELLPINFKDQVVTSELFYEFVDFLSGNIPNKVTSVTVIEKAKNYRSAKIKLWINRDFDKLLPDFIN